MLKYYKIDVKVQKEYVNKPHYFLGSTLRGTFGTALKQVVCINPSKVCKDCFALDSCIFYDFFELRNKAHLYRFSKKLGEKNYDFSLYLFEAACEKISYILSAIIQMLEKKGFGISRETLKVSSIYCNNKLIYVNNSFDIKGIKPRKFAPKEFIGTPLKLRFLTPLRIKKENKLLSKKPELHHIILSIHHRLHDIKEKEKFKLPFKSSYKEIKSEVFFKDLTRFSNRQKTKMKIGGILGYIEYEQIDKNSLELLQLGEIIGVGKQTVFGLGEIKIL